MIRSAASKLMGMVRATVLFVAVAVILAVVFGADSPARGANPRIYEREQNTFVGALSTGNIFPACDVGDAAISGGYRLLATTSHVIRSERYAPDPKYWAFAIRNDAQPADAITVEVVCMDSTI